MTRAGSFISSRLIIRVYTVMVKGMWESWDVTKFTINALNALIECENLIDTTNITQTKQKKC